MKLGAKTEDEYNILHTQNAYLILVSWSIGLKQVDWTKTSRPLIL